MRRIPRPVLPILIVSVALLLLAGIVWAASVTSRETTIDGKATGEVLIGEKVVIRFRDSAGGLSPAERALIVAGRLRVALEKSEDPKQFEVKEVSSAQSIFAGEKLIAQVLAEDAKAADMTVSELAYAWRNNIIRALNDTSQEKAEPETEVTPAAKSEEVDWEGAKNKWVPILDVGNQGVRIGAAQVAGPEVQVNKCKAVAQLELRYKDFGRIKVYVPIDSMNVTRLNRVQGVSVWAVGDVRIVKF